MLIQSQYNKKMGSESSPSVLPLYMFGVLILDSSVAHNKSFSFLTLLDKQSKRYQRLLCNEVVGKHLWEMFSDK